MKIQRRIKRGWMNLRVERIGDETHDTKTFFLVDADENGRQFDYTAGQYLTFRFDDISEKPVVRSYTMSSSPCEPDYVAFTVKEVEDGFISRWLCRELKVGDVLRARGPIGKFCFDPEKDHKNLFMIAGGSGVTPFVSIMRELEPFLGKENFPETLSLLVSYRSKKDLICWKELQTLSQHPKIEVQCTLSREDEPGFWHGRITDEMIAKFVAGRYENATFFSCGPEAIMAAVVSHCQKQGVPMEHIKTESFAT